MLIASIKFLYVCTGLLTGLRNKTCSIAVKGTIKKWLKIAIFNYLFANRFHNKLFLLSLTFYVLIFHMNILILGAVAANTPWPGR